MTTRLHIHFAKPVNRLALAISLALALSACGDNASSSTPTPTPTPTPDPTPAPSSCVANPLGDTALYLRGGMNSWNAAEEYKFNYVCDHFELVTETSGDQSFKIGDAGWSATSDFGGASSSQVVAGTPLPLALQGSNLSFTFSGVNKLVLDLSKSVTEPTLTIYQCPDNPLGETALFLRGGMNSWTAVSDYLFTYSCDAFYLNVNETGEYEFKLADSGWSAASSFGSADSASNTLTHGTPLAITSDAILGASTDNLKFNFTGAHTAKLTLDADASNPKLTIGDQTFVGSGNAQVTDPIALSVSFDSRNSNFKQPFGAVTEGQTIDYALTALPGIDSVNLVIDNRTLEGNQDLLKYDELTRVPLSKTVIDGSERWGGSYNFPTKGVYGYYFEFTIGDQVYVYQNNKETVYWTSEKGSAGPGLVAFKPKDSSQIRRYRQTVYLSDFAVPEWAKDAVYYYIFPERFRNGDTANDPKPGTDTYLDQAVEFHSNWNDKPYVPGENDGNSGDDEVYNNDFFGGDLAGIIEKLDYLVDLGVNTLYINPIFEAPSNHKYDTADYMQVDDNFGDNALFAKLTAEAKARGIRVILDTSLNHTGSDSAYFDRYGKYPGVGAFEGGTPHPESPYYSWYKFFTDATTPEGMYQGWVGVSTLPELVESESWKNFAYRNDDSVTKYWLDQGLSGWRMDVAPWVSDEFWREWRTAVKSKDPDALTVAETWFDASKFFLGDEFDSTMNYIFRNAVLDYAAGGNAAELYHNLELMRENYPPQAFYALMNLLSTHDAARALYKFGYTSDTTDAAVIVQAKQRVKLAALFQMSYPGAPAIFYGDEVGVTGGEDPFNRGTYPWADVGGKPDTDLLAAYKSLIKMRKDYPILRQGTLSAPLYSDANIVVLLRELNGQKALVMLNNGTTAKALSLALPATLAGSYQDVLTSSGFTVAEDGSLSLTVPALYGRVLISQ